MSSGNSWVLTHITSFSKTCEIKPCKNVEIYSCSAKPILLKILCGCVSLFFDFIHPIKGTILSCIHQDVPCC